MPLRILHISDLHERAAFEGMPTERLPKLTGDAQERGIVLGKKFYDSLREVTGGRVDLVCLTGDVADWGHPAEYEAASARLTKILKTVGIEPDRLFVVPGNHDVQRAVNSTAWRGIRDWHEMTHDGSTLGRWLSSVHGPPPGIKSEWKEEVAARTAAFWKWAKAFGCANSPSSESMPFGYRFTFPIGTWPRIGVPIHIIGLDSAWLCGGNDDQGRILVTEEQVNAHVRNGEHPLDGFRVALVHHPLSHLGDHQAVWAQLADNGVDLVLHGHQHMPAVSLTSVPGTSLRTLAAGCLMEGDLGKNWPNGFQLIDIDVMSRGVRVHFRKWARSATPRFWARGSDIYQNAPDGILEWGTGEHAPSRKRSRKRSRSSARKARKARKAVKTGAERIAVLEEASIQGDLDAIHADTQAAEFREDLRDFERQVPSLYGGLVFLDVNGFKSINATFGQDVGNAILREIPLIGTAALDSIAAKSEAMNIHRFRADEYWLALPVGIGTARAKGYADRICDRVSSFNWNGICPGLWVTIACGIALSPSMRDQDAALCLLRAMMGARLAKRNGETSFGPEYLSSAYELPFGKSLRDRSIREHSS